MTDFVSNNWKARLHLGTVYQSFGRSEEAVRIFRQLLAECRTDDIRERAKTQLMKIRSKLDDTVPKMKSGHKLSCAKMKQTFQ
jgi:lipopolysaccharide biosynthesis regulator YciM